MVSACAWPVSTGLFDSGQPILPHLTKSAHKNVHAAQFYVHIISPGLDFFVTVFLFPGARIAETHVK
jgi:hypothetical protein